MSDFQFDHDSVRARVEKRLAPRMRLLRQRTWLFVHMVVFFATMIFIHSGARANSLFYYSSIRTIPSRDYFDSVTNALRTIPSTTYETWHVYPFVSFLTAVWVILIVIHLLNVWAAFGRERVIQREMDRELELEKMRLQIELAQINRGAALNNDGEKPKRVVGLADDGELVFEDEPVRRSVGHSASRR